MQPAGACRAILRVDSHAIQAGGFLDNEFLTGADGRTHEQLEHVFGLAQSPLVGQRDTTQGAVRPVHRGLRELVGVHFAQALVALDGFLPGAARAAQCGELTVQLVLGVGVDVLALLAPLAGDLDAVQGRHGRVDAAGFDHGAHVAEEQGEQQGADVRAVDVGVGHENDLAVASLGQVEGASRARADHLDDIRAFGVGEHVRGRGLLHVEDLASDREQRLVVGVAGGLGRAQGGVALDDEQLGLLDVLKAAVRELGGQRGGFQRVLLA